MDEETQKLLRESIRLSAKSIILIFDLLMVILIAKNKRNWSAVNVFIAAFALTDAIYSLPSKKIFQNSVDTEMGCKVFGFIMEMTYVLRFFILPTIFVTIAKFKQIRLRTVCAVIVVEIVVSAVCSLPFVNHYKLRESDENSVCVFLWNGVIGKIRMRLVCEASCLFLAGSVLMMNRKQFKVGKSLGFFVSFFIHWLPAAVLNIVYFMDDTIEFPDYINQITTIIYFMALVVKSIFLFMMFEEGNEIPSGSRTFVDVELVENRNQ
jgi:hypothetical protein